MPSRILMLLVAIFMVQHLDMGVSSPLHRNHSKNCQWNELKHLTHKLYEQAQKIYDSMNSTDNTVLDDIPRIECNHRCGPRDLHSNPETCLERIAHILSYYKAALSHLTKSSQNEHFTNVRAAIADILTRLEACNYKATHLPAPKEVTEEFLRMKVGSPLLSVSILIARVFSLGNPADHIIHPMH
ncbi:interleukin-23 subunit alpha-like [Hyla sarda]|uniref:interleukin-23 subunit alpha-like n=1 Tax=Hyla sarda TaxID=327740 RepID=UPI0024C37FDC|nr:interleukin-23 subunit alpha-like [Hyla sarda]